MCATDLIPMKYTSMQGNALTVVVPNIFLLFNQRGSFYVPFCPYVRTRSFNINKALHRSNNARSIKNSNQSCTGCPKIYIFSQRHTLGKVMKFQDVWIKGGKPRSGWTGPPPPLRRCIKGLSGLFQNSSVVSWYILFLIRYWICPLYKPDSLILRR